MPAHSPGCLSCLTCRQESHVVGIMHSDIYMPGNKVLSVAYTRVRSRFGSQLPALQQKMRDLARGFCVGSATLSGECSGTWELLWIVKVKMGSLEAS